MELQQLSMHNCIRLLWVSGHSNIDGNENTDELTKQAALMDYVGPEPALGLSLANVKREISQWSVQEHNRRWAQHQELSSSQAICASFQSTYDSHSMLYNCPRKT